MPNLPSAQAPSAGVNTPPPSPPTQPIPTTAGGGMVPPVQPVKTRWRSRLWSAEQDERNQLEKDGSQSHNIRRVAAYGALLLALVLYCGGLLAIGVFLGLIPTGTQFPAEKWHFAVAILAALFTVPTVLMLAVLKASSPKLPDDVSAKSVHEALGQMLTKIFDKLLDMVK